MFLLFRQLEVFSKDIVDRQDEIRWYSPGGVYDFNGFSTVQKKVLMQDSFGCILKFFQELLKGLITNLIGIFGNFLLILIYVFLLLMNRNKFEDFIIQYVSEERKNKVYKILEGTLKVTHKYHRFRSSAKSALCYYRNYFMRGYLGSRRNDFVYSNFRNSYNNL